jgi:hypothetical protein
MAIARVNINRGQGVVMHDDDTNSDEKDTAQPPTADPQHDPAGSSLDRVVESPKGPGIAVRSALRAGYVSSNGGKCP